MGRGVRGRAAGWAVLAMVLVGCPRAPEAPTGPREWDRVTLRSARGTPRLEAIAGTGAADAWAVGAMLDERRGRGARPAVTGCAFHFDGRRWTESPLPAGTGSLSAVAVAAPDDAWAAGERGTVLHFDGRAWAREPLPPAYAQASFSDLWAWPTELWAAAGTYGTPGRILRRTASGWTEVPIPAAASRSVDQLWGTSPSDLWIPSGRAWHYDGTAWRQATVGTATLRTVHGTGPGDVWMLGGRGSSMSSFGWRAAAFHYDGRRWAEVPVPGEALFLWHVCAASPTEAVAVGSVGHALRWDGRAWRRSTTGLETRGGGQEHLRDVHCAPGMALAVGGLGPDVLRLRAR